MSTKSHGTGLRCGFDIHAIIVRRENEYSGAGEDFENLTGGFQAVNGSPTATPVGIDLGTTNSLVAYMQGDSPVVIPGEDGLNLVPSVVALSR